MSRDGRTIIRVGEADYTFRLAWGQIVELQEARDAGPFVVLGRLEDKTWNPDDVSVVLVLGLVGAGLPYAEALTTVEGWLAGRLPAENAFLAHAVLLAGLVGAPDEPVGKTAAADQKVA